VKEVPMSSYLTYSTSLTFPQVCNCPPMSPSVPSTVQVQMHFPRRKSRHALAGRERGLTTVKKRPT
jgi:hypothetical protein